MKLTAEIGKVPQLSDRPFAVLTINAKAPVPDTRHTVLVLDCSGSMAPSIDDVRRDAQKFCAELGEKDYASVIIFSGHGRAKCIAGPTKCDADGRTMLTRAIEKDVRVLDTTVFSEPLALTLETVQRLTAKGTAQHAVLFTDGCAVPTRWNVDTEHEKSFAVARQLRDASASVSVIGYGVYYDLAFITRLVAEAGNTGIYRHISEIDDFGPAIQSIREVQERTASVLVGIRIVPDVGTAGRVLKTAPELVAVGDQGKLTLRSVHDGSVTLYVELSEPATSLTVYLTDAKHTQTRENVTGTPLTTEMTANIIRALGALAFLVGDRETAAELLALTSDDGLAEKAANAYTDREQRETGDLFRRAFVGRKFIGAGLKATGPNHCVLNVLRTLIEDAGSVVYIPKGAYKRGGLLTRDPRVIEPPHGRTLKVVGYRSEDTRFNFSLTCLKDVKVRPVDEAGNVLDGAPAVDRHVFRTYNVVRDGNLVLAELEATLSKASFDALQAAEVIAADAAYDATRVYTLNLRGLKMISSAWAHPATLGLMKLLQEEAELAAEQKALNARKKTLAPDGAAREDSDMYFEKGAEVEGVPVEYYTAQCVEYRLMQHAPATHYEALAAAMTFEQADARVKTVRQRLIVVRFLTRAIVFALEAVQSKVIGWDAGKTTKRGKDEKLEQSATYQGAQLKRVTWSTQVACS